MTGTGKKGETERIGQDEGDGDQVIDIGVCMVMEMEIVVGGRVSVTFVAKEQV